MGKKNGVFRGISSPGSASGVQPNKSVDQRGIILTNSLASGLLVLAYTVTLSAADDKPPFKITTKRDNDKVEVKTEKEKVIFSVHSPFGISNAAIERTGEKWPDAVVLRLHLKGVPPTE
jgi:hypothetical protein